jgi:hypothetical protein
MYCEFGQCIYMAPEHMAYCTSDDQCNQEHGYACVANMCDKLPPEYYPTKPSAPKPGAPPPPVPTPQISGAKPDLTFLIVAAAVAGGLAYFVGRQS